MIAVETPCGFSDGSRDARGLRRVSLAEAIAEVAKVAKADSTDAAVR